MLLLARTTPADKVKKRSEGLSVFLVDIREAKGKGLELKKIEITRLVVSMKVNHLLYMIWP
jgi:alkylation response protein AidB-like acyl-CoA dehydrogenase